MTTWTAWTDTFRYEYVGCNKFACEQCGRMLDVVRMTVMFGDENDRKSIQYWCCKCLEDEILDSASIGPLDEHETALREWLESSMAEPLDTFSENTLSDGNARTAAE
jgi:hypothetical protein